MRVKVWDGSREHYLGEGNLTEEVTVYFRINKDGSLSSEENAEVRPKNIPDDKIIESVGNPKIVLDSGDIVYGCQVWWIPLQEENNGKDIRK